jgi:hypothetical protein
MSQQDLEKNIILDVYKTLLVNKVELKLTDMSSIENAIKELNIIMNILSRLLKYMIIKVDNEKHKELIDKKVVFPENEDTMIVMLAFYEESFDDKIKDMFFNLVTMENYTTIYSMSNINHLLAPFVIDDSFNKDLFARDYLIFCSFVKEMIGHVFKLNADGNPIDYYIES